MPLGAPPPGYTPPPGMPPGMPPTMPYGPPAYGQPAPPSVPYGQPPNYPYGAPPSMPMGAPYPGYPPVAPMGAPPPPRKGRVGLIIGGSIAAVLVFCVVAGGVLYAIGANQPTTTPGALATATTAAQVSPTATPEEIALYQNAFTTVSDDWANDTNCFFGPGGYHIKGGYICYAPVGDQANVDVTVDVQQVSGPNNDVYGLALRLDRTAHTDYDLNVDALGHWVFYRCSGSTCDRLIDFTAAASLHAGLNVTNKLQAKVKGSHFDFFINGVKVGQFEDSTYTSGLVGLECGESSECVFANLSIAQPR